MALSRVLLDSHVFLWALEQPHKIGAKTTQLITEADSVYVSVVSLWELELQHAAGKFPYTTTKLVEGIKQSGFKLMKLEPSHIQEYGRVKLPHKDPFDTLLVAQSQAEDCLFITADKQILASSHIVQDASK
ncbi:MAG: type II toxin-antitoxin system VapC family toxin [Candidatus Saccharimonadales bacterium]